MLVEVVAGGTVAFVIVFVEEVPLLFSLQVCPIPHIKWLQGYTRDTDLVWGPPFMGEDFTWYLSVTDFVSVRLALHVTRLPTCF